jgi:hypothetical protein
VHYPFEDPGLAVDPPIISQHPDDVAEVRALDNFQLYVRFFDGTDGRVEMRGKIFSEKAGVFASLRDPEEFAKVGIGWGAVMWANELDLAPDAMYEEFKQHGVWVLR